ncbi:hypothetical protein [Dulcicalothrix desertica]|uniref:hypothetical protein n=1 Tax=Dulcicalothrix desertica TaxID=32056 RepID=UPI001647BF93|nr:hypothetical protein [Dulcicalothrix desertica]
MLEDEDVFVRDEAAESLLELNRARLLEVWKKALTIRVKMCETSLNKQLPIWKCVFERIALRYYAL